MSSLDRQTVLAALRRQLEELEETGQEWLPLDSDLRQVKGGDECPVAPTVSPSRETLEDIRVDLGDCRRCTLADSRSTIVFGVGAPHASVVFVGEAPGKDEDQQGEPFVGEAGQLLTRIIEAMGFQRQEVYICNVLKCRPPKNRDPRPEEVEACAGFMLRQVQAIAPKAIIALGTFAAQTLLETKAPISKLRGVFHDYHGIPLMPTFHPAFLLRSPEMKRQVWEDMQQVMKRVGKEPPASRC
jgi:DNA polymerase